MYAIRSYYAGRLFRWRRGRGRRGGHPGPPQELAKRGADRRRGRRRRGRRALLPHAERTLVAYCEAMIRADEPLDFSHVAGRMDFFLSAEDSPRGWRNAMLLTLMEYAPMLV